MATMRERMLAVIRGQSLDRVPFVQYDNIAAPNYEVWARIGRNQMGILRWCSAHRFEHPHCRFEQEEAVFDGRRGWRNILITPLGNLVEERVYIPSMGKVQGFRKRYVQTLDDYRLLMAYLRDIIVVEDTNAIEQAHADFGDDGLPHVSLGRTPFQQLWIQWVSLMDLSLHLLDAPDVVEECMALLGQIQLRAAEVAFRAADKVLIPYIVIADNITAPLIGTDRFRRYCLPYYRAIADRMAEKRIPLFVHMDGDLKPLWGMIGESGVRGLDSLSPPPDNDTSVAEAARMWPEMRLCVNFPSSVHLAADDTIYRQAWELLVQGGHTGRLWIQISENVPPGAWERSYPAIVRAIADFGAP